MKTPGNAPFHIFRRDLLFLVPVVVVAAALGLALNTLRSTQLNWIPVPPDVLLARGIDPSVSANEINPPLLDITKVHAAFGAESAVLVDARERAFFELGRIPRAINLSRETFQEEYITSFAAMEKEKPLIVYCSGVNCPDSEVIAKSLLRLGFTNVTVYNGGWEEWMAAGYPTEP